MHRNVINIEVPIPINIYIYTHIYTYMCIVYIYQTFPIDYQNLITPELLLLPYLSGFHIIVTSSLTAPEALVVCTFQLKLTLSCGSSAFEEVVAEDEPLHHMICIS